MTGRGNSAAITSSRLAPANPDRVLLLVMPPSTNLIHVSPEIVTVAGAGWALGADSLPLVIDLKTYGDLVTQEWSVISDAGAPTVRVYEGYLPESVLAAHVKEWRRDGLI